MNLSEFVENHCVGKQYDSCVESPCAFASHSGCRHPLHPKHAVEQSRALDGATGAATLSGLYNCEVCGEEKCRQPGICESCLTPPTEDEIKLWGVEETPRQ